MSTEVRRTLASMQEAARRAGRLVAVRARIDPAEVVRKGPHSELVTDLDIEVSEFLLGWFRSRLPGVGLISEEHPIEPSKSETLHIDPIDGTLNLVHGYFEVAISLGYWKDGRPVAGVVYNPFNRRMYCGEVGRGAWLNGRRIRPSSTTNLSSALVASGWPYVKTAVPAAAEAIGRVCVSCREVRILGSAALALCYVASGILDAYWEEHLGAWDIAGGAAVLTAAGGVASEPEGHELRLDDGRVLASNGHLHAQMKEVCGHGKPQTSVDRRADAIFEHNA